MFYWIVTGQLKNIEIVARSRVVVSLECLLGAASVSDFIDHSMSRLCLISLIAVTRVYSQLTIHIPLIVKYLPLNRILI